MVLIFADGGWNLRPDPPNLDDEISVVHVQSSEPEPEPAPKVHDMGVGLREYKKHRSLELALVRRHAAVVRVSSPRLATPAPPPPTACCLCLPTVEGEEEEEQGEEGEEEQAGTNPDAVAIAADSTSGVKLHFVEKQASTSDLPAAAFSSAMAVLVSKTKQPPIKTTTEVVVVQQAVAQNGRYAQYRQREIEDSESQLAYYEAHRKPGQEEEYCGMCMESVPAADCVTSCRQNHKWCRACLTGFLTAQVHSRELSVRCPAIESGNNTTRCNEVIEEALLLSVRF